MSAKQLLSAELCSIVDAAVHERVVVFGSLPPDGTDLDLLAGDVSREAIRAALGAAGCIEQGSRLVRFAHGAGLEVELVAPNEWGLPETELEALSDQAVPLRGLQWLVEPAPHHRLLILAMRRGARGAALSARHTGRIASAVADDPDAWRKAAAMAPAWRADPALERLRLAYDGNQPRAIARARQRAGRVRAVIRRTRRGSAVIALSGVDGSGKSTQARNVAKLLGDLGLAVEVEWIPLASNTWLARVAAPLKRALSRHPAFRPSSSSVAGDRGLTPSPGSLLRERSRIVNYGWAVLSAVANGLSHRHRATRHRLAGRVVIFDRYVFDSAARLRFFYGEDRSLRIQRALVRILSPRPTAAFFLDIPATASRARKTDVWNVEELERQVRLYREEHARYPITRIDGELPAAEVAGTIATEAWRRIRSDEDSR